jgi:U2-associated protein SR140
MFRGGARWHPPRLLDGGTAAAGSTLADNSVLTTAQRDELDAMLLRLTSSRADIAAGMLFCLDHATAAVDVVESLVAAVCAPESPAPAQVARLYLVSDVLYNSGSATARHAALFRAALDPVLPAIFTHLNNTYNAIDGRLRAEQFRVRDFRGIVWVGAPPSTQPSLPFLSVTKPAHCRNKCWPVCWPGRTGQFIHLTV